jgi:1-acyl-sn-glycerol-3-phosphate acyltransferase
VFLLIPAIGVYTIVLGTMSLASSLFDARGYFRTLVCAHVGASDSGTTGVSVRVEGLEHVAPNGSYVFVSNHQSHYDTAGALCHAAAPARIIAKESLGRFPFVGWHLRRTGHILVDRRRPDRSAIFAWAERLLSQGLSLIVYPEGTRSPNGLVQRFKPGSFQIALQAGLPVVPISISGTRQVLRKGDLAARPGIVRLVLIHRSRRAACRTRIRVSSVNASARSSLPPSKSGRRLTRPVTALSLGSVLNSQFFHALGSDPSTCSFFTL